MPPPVALKSYSRDFISPQRVIDFLKVEWNSASYVSETIVATRLCKEKPVAFDLWQEEKTREQ